MKKRISIKFGQKVRQERLKKNISQEKFAVQVGVHRTYIGMIEKGEQNITLMNIEKITKALGIPLDDLMKF